MGGGAALALNPADAVDEDIAPSVLRLLHEPSFRAAAGDVAAEIASMPVPAEVVRVLSDLA